MKRIIFTLLTVGFMASALMAHAAPFPGSFADLVEKYSPAVVNISTSNAASEEDAKPSPFGENGQGNPFSGTPFENFFNDFFENMPQQRTPMRSLGSGVVISPDGYVVTNAHVVANATDIITRFADETELKAEVIGTDDKNDIALLKLNAQYDLPYAKLGNSDDLRVGDWVVAIGNPFGLGGSVSAGILSARGRHIGQGPYDDFLQTDAAINPGNSGGPLFDADGDVIGINTAILSRTGGSQGIGFAVPSSTVKLIVEQIKEYGRPIRGWLGVRIQTVTPELAEALGLNDKEGALVAGVVPDSPADKAGIKDGDVIVAFDGTPIQKMIELPRLVAQTAVGTRAKIDVMRDGKRLRLSTEIAELDEQEAEMARAGRSAENTEETLGMVLGELTPQIRQQLKLEEDVSGVLIRSVKRGSPAMEAGLRRGDVVVQVNRRPVGSVQDVVTRMTKDQDNTILLLINRSGRSMFVAVKRKNG